MDGSTMDDVTYTNHTPSNGVPCDHTSCNETSCDVTNVLSSISLLIINSRISNDTKNVILYHGHQKINAGVVHSTVDEMFMKLQNVALVPLYIEVKGQPKESCDSEPIYSILIERWGFETIKRPGNSTCTMTVLPLLLQAIRSFLHFSQISSWAITYGGQLPFNIIHSVGPSVMTSHESSCPLETHLFPLVPLSPLTCLQVSVEHLPRLDQIPPLLLPSDNDVISDITSHVTKPTDVTLFPFSPPTPSPLSPKLLSNLTISKEPNVSMGSDNIRKSPIRVPDSSGYKNTSRGNGGSRCLISRMSPILIPKSKKSLDDSCNGHVHSNHRHTPSSHHESSSLATPNDSTSTSGSSTLATSSVNGRTSNGCVAMYNGWKGSVRPPGASSPVPHILRNNRRCGDEDRKMKRRSCIINYKSPTRVPPQRSMSLPAAVPNMCLLGTFEESVLNGRIEPLGYVEGFSAELGASGTFCPDHVTLPVTACYFKLSDDGGPSPYLGHIDLSNVGRRGYFVPHKGTIQLTLFNPNKTVVKIFIVRYDHSDMPYNTSTFIRQKTYSRPSHLITTSHTDSFSCLHYLIHLRFLSSKSRRIYLHTDIKLIFARRAPDTDPDLSKVVLHTLDEGPTNPKYGPLTSE